MTKETIDNQSKNKPAATNNAEGLPLWLQYKLALEKAGVTLKPTDPEKESQRQQI